MNNVEFGSRNMISTLPTISYPVEIYSFWIQSMDILPLNVICAEPLYVICRGGGVIARICTHNGGPPQ